MNNGERNEFLIKFKLIDLRDTGNFSFNGSNITSVGFNGTEYSSLPSSFNIKSLNSMQDSDIIQLAKAIGVSKSPARAKSDVSINGRGYSVKFMKKANPAIVNHTNRKGFSNVALLLNINIYNLDHLISNYWSLRQTGIISEDILNNNLNSPFQSHKAILEPYINYFLFDGTGSGYSVHRADFILDFDDPNDTNTWRVLDKYNAFNQLWDELVFSLRASKGMPANYPKILPKDLALISPWTKFQRGKHRGALHIRVKR